MKATKQEGLGERIHQSSSLPQLKPQSSNSLAALQKLKADLAAKRNSFNAKSSSGEKLEEKQPAESPADKEGVTSSPEQTEAKSEEEKENPESPQADPTAVPPPEAAPADPPPPPAAAAAAASPAPTETNVDEEFEKMMDDLKFTEAQRKQMASLPASHKQTILTQWKKKKAALQERLNSISVATAPPTHRTSSHNGPGPESSKLLLAKLDERRQGKMEALRKLNEQLALKRQIQEKGIQREDLSPGDLQKLIKDLQTQRKTRREMREQKVMARVEKMKREGKISSLADMQEAIRQANENLKLRAEERKEKRCTKITILKELESTGIKIPQDNPPPQKSRMARESIARVEPKETKIDSQLENFLTSMVKLEEEWKKQEQMRIQRQVEFEILQKDHEQALERIKKSDEILSESKTRLTSIASTFAMASNKHPEDQALQTLQKELADLLQHLGMESALVSDHRTAEQIEEERKAAIQKRTEELEKEAEESEALGGFLAQLRGAKLKKVGPEEVAKRKEAPPPPALDDSFGSFSSLQDTLRGALEMRKLAIMDSDSDEDSDDDDLWEDEDYDGDEFNSIAHLMSSSIPN